MAQVIYIRPSKQSGRLSVGIDDNGKAYSLSVSDKTVAELGISAGCEIDAVCEELFFDDARYRAMKKALSLLSYADNNKRTLYAKLIRAGFKSEIASRTVEECVRLGYVDEKRQLERLILKEANEAYRGREAIRQRLLAKGYLSRDIDGITDELVADERIDFVSNFELLCKERGCESEEERRALAYKLGYFGV